MLSGLIPQHQDKGIRRHYLSVDYHFTVTELEMLFLHNPAALLGLQLTTLVCLASTHLIRSHDGVILRP